MTRSLRIVTALALVADYGEAVTGEDAVRSVALLAAMADEAAGRYGAAVVKVEGVLAGLDSKTEAEQIDALSRVAEALAAQAGEGARGAIASQPVAETEARGEAAGGLSEGFVLGAAYPNPSNGRTVIPVALAERAEVRVTVYDMLGREVAVLAEGHLAAGAHRLHLDASVVQAGVYVVRASAEGHAATARLTVIR
jgi:hypothetical protein